MTNVIMLLVSRRQLEGQLARQQTADKQTHDELAHEARRQQGAQLQAEEKANNARRRLAEEVQLFQQMQIGEQRRARCCHNHLYSQGALTSMTRHSLKTSHVSTMPNTLFNTLSIILHNVS